MRNIKEILEDWRTGKLENNIYATVDENNNNVTLEVAKDYLKLTTYQDNGWSRINHYYLDGTVDEMYER